MFRHKVIDGVVSAPADSRKIADEVTKVCHCSCVRRPPVGKEARDCVRHFIVVSINWATAHVRGCCSPRPPDLTDMDVIISA
eukprot:scaffold91675_cov36-Cyclotella_meneghiniana.AAC.1